MGHKFLYITIGLLLFLCKGNVRSQAIITRPSDATGKLGETAEFCCQVDLEYYRGLTWKSNDNIVYSFLGGEDHFPFNDTNKYDIKRHGDTCILKVLNLEFSDGGKYICEAAITQSVANLVVLGNPSFRPLTSTPAEGDYVEYVCEAEFGVPVNEISQQHYPYLKIYLDGDRSLGNSSEQERNTLCQVYHTSVNRSMHGKHLYCEIGTSNPKMTETNSIIIDLQYSVRNVSYFPQHEKYEIGSRITCSADGNPDPVFEWEDAANSKNLIKGNVLNITKDMAGQNYWICTARNFVKNSLHDGTVHANFKTER